MREQTITDLNEVRDGDICTVEIEGHQYTGPAYSGVGNVLKWGGHTLRYNGVPRPFVVFLSATRETPSLPTKEGSVILVHEAGGEVYDPPVLAVHDGTALAPWGVARQIDGFDWFGDGAITRWQECDVTPRGEVIWRPTVRAVREAVGDA